LMVKVLSFLRLVTLIRVNGRMAKSMVMDN
jgi:hypothetical protein